MIPSIESSSQDRIRLLAVAGSTSSQSRCRALAGLCLSRARDTYPMVETVELDIDFLRLPILDADQYRTGELFLNDRVRSLTAQIQAAHAYVLVTPVLHGSYSGALKNLLDHLPAEAFRGRPVLIAVQAANLRGTQAARGHLDAVVSSLGGWSTPTSIVAETADFDDLWTSTLIHRVDHGLAELITFSSRFLVEPRTS